MVRSASPAPPSAVDLASARAAVAEVAPRVVDLVRSIRRPEAPALGTWTVIETATHLTHVYDVVGRLLAGEMESPLRDIWELNGTTRALVAEDGERDPGALADRIATRADRFLERLDAATGASRAWLVEGTQVSVPTFACHLLSESLIHGWDIAQVEDRPWAIERDHARLVLLGFLLPVFEAVGGRNLVTSTGESLNGCLDLRVRGGGRAFFVFENGDFRVEPPSDRRVDCHLSVDPAAFLLVGWGRRSQWHAITRGQLLAWGRRPWVALRLRAALRNP